MVIPTNAFGADAELIVSCENAVVAKDVLALCLLGRPPLNKKAKPVTDNATLTVLAAMDDDDDDEEDDGEIVVGRTSQTVRLDVISGYTFREPVVTTVVSCMATRRHGKNGFTRLPLFYFRGLIRDPSTTTLQTELLPGKIDWHATYHKALKRYIGLELDGRDMTTIGVEPEDESAAFGCLRVVSKTSVGRCIDHSNLSALMGTKCGHLAAANTVRQLYGEDRLVAQYHLFCGGDLAIVEPERLKSVFRRDYHGTSFEEFCDFIERRMRRDVLLIKSLHDVAVSDLGGYKWMDYEFIEMLTKSLKLAFDPERIVGTRDIDDVVSTFCDDKNKMLKRHANALYDSHQIRVSRDDVSFLRCKLSMYDPAYFFKTPLKKCTPRQFVKVNAPSFSGSVRKQYHKHVQTRFLPAEGIGGAGRDDAAMCCMSATPDTVYSGTHRVDTEKAVLPCPVFSFPERKTVWRKIVCSDPVEYQVPDINKTVADIMSAYTPAAAAGNLDRASYDLTTAVCQARKLAGLEWLDANEKNLNEVFNENLSVGAIPFDVDLKGYSEPPTFSDLCVISRGLVRVVKLFVNLLLKRPHDTPVAGCEMYCYKSECDDGGYDDFDSADHYDDCDNQDRHGGGGDDEYDNEDEPWNKPCTCKKKVGLHVTVSLPANVLIRSVVALGSAVELLTSFARTDTNFLRVVSTFGGDIKSALDTAVWAPNKTLRIPYAYKAEWDRRLMPMYVLENDNEAGDKPRVLNKICDLASDRFLTLAHRDHHPMMMMIPDDDNFVVFDGCMAAFRDSLDFQLSGRDTEIKIGGDDDKCVGDDDFMPAPEVLKIKTELSARLCKLFGGRGTLDRHVEHGLATTLTTQLAITFPRCGSVMSNATLAYDIRANDRARLYFNTAPGSRPVNGKSQPFPVCLAEDVLKKAKKVMYHVTVMPGKNNGDSLLVSMYGMCFKCDNNASKLVTRYELFC